MKRREFGKTALLTLGAVGLNPVSRIFAQLPEAERGNAATNGKPQVVTGVVYLDKNGSGKRDGSEKGLKGIYVSNGRDIVKTDSQGRYNLPLLDDGVIFVIKPRDYMTPVDEQNLPRFHYHHRPIGSPAQNFPGIAPTGNLPASLDFPLTPRKEPDKFRVVLFGDPQSRNQEEVDYLAHDIVEELIGTEAAFGISLGDEAFDDLSIYQNQNREIALLGMPWYNVMGNHDINYDAKDRTDSAETYKSIFGPTYYSFNYGPVHFIVLDDVAYDGKPLLKERGSYHGELGERQLEFIKNDLATVPNDQLVVLLMHMPILNMDDAKSSVKDRQALYRIIENRPHLFSISAHTHFQEHIFIDRQDGWNGARPHHHFNHATVCGSWWSGVPDERSIPHTTMRDGAPNGYSFLNFDGNKYSIEFKAARRSADYQMAIYAPSEVQSASLATTEILANVFAGSARSKVEMRVGNGPWLTMQRVEREDPAYASCKALEMNNKQLPGRKLPKAIKSPHIWGANLPSNLAQGTHLVEVRTVDMFGHTYSDRRIMRVV